MLNWFKKSPPPAPHPATDSASPPPPSAPDYAQVLQTLLEAVSQGKTWGDLQGIFIAHSLKPEQFAQWLEQQYRQWQTEPEQYQQLGQPLIQLGRIAKGLLAIAAAEIGQQLQSEEVVQPEAPKTDQENQAEVWLKQGNQKFDAGDFEGAIACYNKAIEFKTDQDEAWYSRGVALANLGQLEQALASYDKAIQFKADYHKVWGHRGLALFNLERWEEAIASFDKAVEFKPDFYEVWYVRGLALLILERWEEAIASYDKAVEFKADYHEAWYYRGVALGNLGRFEAAIASFEKVIEFKADNHEAWYYRGVALEKLGQLEEAIASYDKAVEFKVDYHEAWHNQGNALFDLKRLEEAIASYDKAVEFKADYHEAWYYRGVALGNLGRLEEAIASHDKAVEFKPNYHEVWHNRGNALFDLKRFEAAIASYDKAVEFKPDFHEVWYNRGVALGNLERLEEAIVSYDKAVEFKADKHEAWNNRGVALEKLGQLEEAIASYDKAVEFKADKYEAWHNRGVALEKLGQLEEAIANFDKAIELKAGYHEAWHNRGIVLEKLGRFEEAIASHDNAIKLKSDYYNAWISRAGMYCRGSQGGLLRTNLLQAIQQKSSYSPIHIATLREAIPHLSLGTYGYAVLFSCLGDAYHRHSSEQRDARSYWKESVCSYEVALQTLTAEAFPEEYLEVLQGLIPPLLALGETAAAQQYRAQGLQVWQQLINADIPIAQKRQLETKFLRFSRVAVESWVAEGNPIAALEAADYNKNRRLTRILNNWGTSTLSPCYADMRSLLTPTTALLYWHLSDDALITFCLTPTHPEPLLLDGDTRDPKASHHPAQRHRAQQLQTWLSTWNSRYKDYRTQKAELSDHPWRTHLADQLQQLREILGLEPLATDLAQVGIQHLLLIPHRDLHSLPLSFCLPQFVCTTLPSAQVGLTLQQHSPTQPFWESDRLLSVDDPTTQQPAMPYAQLESALIRHLLPHHTALDQDNATPATVTQGLQTPHRLFHFTGHAGYNIQHPEHSALLLADDQPLTAATLCHLPLQSYDLVCLSACETSLTGTQTLTDDDVGLANAFLQAGAGAILSTLWNVSEISNAWLILRFYERLLTGLSPAVALKQAQTWLATLSYSELMQWLQDWLARLPNAHPHRSALEDEIKLIQTKLNASKIELRDQPYADPYHWAAFTLTGLTPLPS